ncbi:MAG: GAF domain-containing protein [Chloroflexi bacterium]|jgi:PAS domain S-box-containing protein|nr:GAF domain-containing protein [Chloroflexota bacterium]
MEEQDLWAQANDIHVLWERLASELSPIFDAHGVCASVAYEIAVYTGVKTVVALSGPLRQYYDVWICDPIGALQQTRWEGSERSFAQVIDGNEPAYLEKFGLPADVVLGSDLWLLARDAVLAVPLPYPRRADDLVPAGVLCLLDPPEGKTVNLESVGPLAMHITTYLDRAFLRHERDRQQVEFDIVYDLTYSLTATLSMENIFSQLTDPVRRTLNVEAVSIGLVEPVSEDIIFVESLLGPMFADLPPIRLRSGQGIAGQVAQTGEPLIVNNVYRDQRFYAGIDQNSGFRTHSILCVPLKVEQRVIGVLEAINKRIGNFHESDLRLLQAIASPLAAAIENARLHGDVLAEKRRVETIFASMSEGLLTVNAEGRVTATNESLLTLLGTEDGDALQGQWAHEVINVETSETLEAFMERVRHATGDFPQIACDLIHPDGQRVPVLISGASIKNEAGELEEMIVTFSDLRQIREVERMRDDFFHNIVHELRTPLATILMYARLLREGKAHGDKAKEDRFLGVIERESDRLQRMVRQMLQLAKLEARELQRSAELVNLNLVFDDILPPLADRAMDKGLTFSQRIPPALPPIVGNEEMIYSVFKNLVENAVKFTMSGMVRVEARVENGTVEVVVRDEGIGVPEAAKPNLFKRFYRAQSAVERGIAGSGLGLYMVKEAVVKHNGTIDVESVEGEGTTFTVRLPASNE